MVNLTPDNSNIVFFSNYFKTIIFNIINRYSQFFCFLALAYEYLILHSRSGHRDDAQFRPRHGFEVSLDFLACGFNARRGIDRKNDLGNSLTIFYKIHRMKKNGMDC